MKVGVVVSRNFPSDTATRWRKMAVAFDDAGHDAVVFATNAPGDPAQGRVASRPRPVTEELPYAVVRRFSWLVSTPLYRVVAAPIPLNPLWTAWLFLQLGRADADVAVASDLRCGLPTLVAGRLLGVPVVFDLAEHWPGYVRSVPPNSLRARVTHDPRLVAVLEALTVTLADRVLVVCRERGEQVVAAGRADAADVTVVRNTPRLQAFDRDAEADVGAVEGAGFSVVYLGVLREFRGVDVLVDAAAALAERGERVDVVVAGDGPARAALERRAANRGVADRVHFLGWVRRRDVGTVLTNCAVGAIPHRPNAHVESTLPTKLFDYMAAGLPVVTTPAAPVCRVVEETGCGSTLDAGADAAAVGDALLDLRDSSGRAGLGRAGREAVESRYNWAADAARLVAAVEECAVEECAVEECAASAG